MFDATVARRWLALALAGIERDREAIDSLNVYPVPDGDTGTNLHLTLVRAAQEVQGLGPDAGLAQIAEAAATGALLGARGNSGIITSQLLRGWAEAFDGVDEAGPSDLVRALRRADEEAWLAVETPVEGTILSVTRAAALAADAAPDDVTVDDLVRAVAHGGPGRAGAHHLPARRAGRGRGGRRRRRRDRGRARRAGGRRHRRGRRAAPGERPRSRAGGAELPLARRGRTRPRGDVPARGARAGGGRAGRDPAPHARPRSATASSSWVAPASGTCTCTSTTTRPRSPRRTWPGPRGEVRVTHLPTGEVVHGAPAAAPAPVRARRRRAGRGRGRRRGVRRRPGPARAVHRGGGGGRRRRPRRPGEHRGAAGRRARHRLVVGGAAAQRHRHDRGRPRGRPLPPPTRACRSRSSRPGRRCRGWPRSPSSTRPLDLAACTERMSAAAGATRHGAVTVAAREAVTQAGRCRPGDVARGRRRRVRADRRRRHRGGRPGARPAARARRRAGDGGARTRRPRGAGRGRHRPARRTARSRSPWSTAARPATRCCSAWSEVGVRRVPDVRPTRVV